MKYKSNKTTTNKTTTNKNMTSLTEENLIALGLKKTEPVSDPVSPVPEKTIKTNTKKERVMSDKVRQQNIDWYNMLMQEFLSDNTIDSLYEQLALIAKKKYKKDAKLAEFQEQFYQEFIHIPPNRLSKVKLTAKFNEKEYHKSFVEKLQKIREKAEKAEKNS